jgi:methyl-accepting chemotaxis protein
MAGALKDTGLAKVWELVVKHQKPAISDFGIYPPTGAPAAFVGAPVLSSQTRQFLGVLAARVNINRINQIMTWGEGSGKTAEVYVVGKDLLMRCQSHFEKDPTLLKKKVETEPVTQAFEGKQGSFVAKAYRVEATYAYSGLVGLNKQKQFMADFDWAMVNEEDRAEALRPMAAQSYRLIAFALVASALVILVALLLARGIAGPIIAISDVASQVSQGNLSIQVPQFKRGDEVGALGEAVRVMVASVRNSAMSLQEGIQILSSAAAEISATVAQVATSTTQTSSAVTETTTTVEEVKQAAKLASERAKTVSQSAQQAFQISEAGRKATDDTVHRINLIKEQMESIGETVVRLSEHSQAIEEIIATVQDLADQSNLLAVNASIEAARAGEQGRGFAVVAHEIKALADQSKQATQQVRSILDDTRKWVSAVVMATEQGGRAVRAGVEQSTAAGEAIQKLSASVGTSSHAASVIDTTLEQQFVGIDQVANAMASIEHAMKQTVGATAQLDDAARRLALLGEQLKELMERWKV